VSEPVQRVVLVLVPGSRQRHLLALAVDHARQRQAQLRVVLVEDARLQDLPGPRGARYHALAGDGPGPGQPGVPVDLAQARAAQLSRLRRLLERSAASLVWDIAVCSDRPDRVIQEESGPQALLVLDARALALALDGGLLQAALADLDPSVLLLPR